jgi:hypothetical protein
MAVIVGTLRDTGKAPIVPHIATPVRPKATENGHGMRFCEIVKSYFSLT